MSCCMNSNYVKFLRGTPAAWDALSKKDKDTLYFISEKDATTGKLYLGNKLISDSSFDGSLTLDKIEDVLVSENIDPNSILVYNSEEGVWENKPLEEALSTVLTLFKGASDLEDGAVGLVPAPAAGEQNFFLRGDGTWAEVKNSESSFEWGEF